MSLSDYYAYQSSLVT
jgi:hypothetical protein